MSGTKPGSSAQVLEHRRVYEGQVLALDLDEVEEPGGVRAGREVVRHRGSVAALPVHADGRIVLIRQYRYAVDQLVWEIPAGRLDPGETPEQGACREVEEEVGLSAGQMESISVFFTTPGFCDETMHLFRATNLREIPARPEADERIEARIFTLDEAREMVRRGQVREGKTIVAILLEVERRAARDPGEAL